MCLIDEFGHLLERCEVNDCPDIIAFCIFIEVDTSINMAVARLGIKEATRLAEVSLRLHKERERKKHHDRQKHLARSHRRRGQTR